ncbi:PilZ domain-containing protein [Sporolactobacillus sp. THM7-7]|nr:PilZ domain-containing protein [Sporolactobacillus sp. THM7-7]
MMYDLALTGIIVFEALIIIVGYYFYHNKTISRQKAAIGKQERRFRANRVSQNAYEEKREHHRIQMNREACTIRIIDFGEQCLKRLNNRTFNGAIIDISLGGLKFSSDIDFPIKDDVLIELSFQVAERKLRLKGTIVRKEMKRRLATIFYGVQFRHLTSKEEKDLQHAINQMDLSKSRLVKR